MGRPVDDLNGELPEAIGQGVRVLGEPQAYRGACADVRCAAENKLAAVRVDQRLGDGQARAQCRHLSGCGRGRRGRNDRRRGASGQRRCPGRCQVTSRQASAPCGRTSTTTVPPLGVCFKALSTRISNTCWSRSGSASTDQRVLGGLVGQRHGAALRQRRRTAHHVARQRRHVHEAQGQP